MHWTLGQQEALFRKAASELARLVAPFCATLCCTAICFTQSELKIETNFVSVPVTVIDRNGRHQAGLKLDNFSLFEDGKEQKITVFESSESPFTALLLLDVSGSMNAHIQNVASAATEFVNQMGPDDSVSIAIFGDDSKIHVLLQPTKKKALNGTLRLQSMVGDSHTTTFNAVELGMKFLESISGRKALILFSDGELFGRGVSSKDNLQMAEETSAVIYTIRYGEYPRNQPGYTDVIMPQDIERYGNTLGITRKELSKLIERVDRYMNALAEKTGGYGFKIDSISHLSETFRKIGSELGQSYLLGYEPTDQPRSREVRTIKVRVNIQNAVVRSRNEVVFTK